MILLFETKEITFCRLLSNCVYACLLIENLQNDDRLR